MHAFATTPWAKVAAIAGRQHGRVTGAQLEAAGLRRGAVQHAVAIGRLHREHYGVYAVGHRAPSDHGRWMSAVLACGHDCALSHRSGARLLRIGRSEGPVPDVTCPGKRARPGVCTHRGPLDGDIMVRDGIPVTTVARTIVDLAHERDEDEVRRMVREAQYLRLFNLEATRVAAARRSTTLLTRLLEDMTITSSELDVAFVDLIKRFPPPKAQKRLIGHRVDYVWERERVAVELDGYNAHVSLDAFQRDRSQGNALQLAGWLLLRFTWDDVHRRPRATLATLRNALRR